MTTGENEPTQYMNQRQGGFKSRNVNYKLITCHHPFRIILILLIQVLIDKLGPIIREIMIVILAF
jgi:hypothetical protein